MKEAVPFFPPWGNHMLVEWGWGKGVFGGGRRVGIYHTINVTVFVELMWFKHPVRPQSRQKTTIMSMSMVFHQLQLSIKV